VIRALPPDELARRAGNGTLVDGTTGMTIDGETLYRGTATGCLQERMTVTERCALPIGGGVSLDYRAARAYHWFSRDDLERFPLMPHVLAYAARALDEARRAPTFHRVPEIRR